MSWTLPIGAQPLSNGVFFRVWAANARRVEVVHYEGDRPSAAYILAAEGDGYFSANINALAVGARYMYRLDGGTPRPDPAARFQPEGVHSPSLVVDPQAFAWSDSDWCGVALDELVVYELHVGTASEAGTFDALIPQLDAIRDLGATAIELMPLADFPGTRNWGYDGVALYAPARCYGTPDDLRRLVDAAHARGLAVLLDVVYNHLGPDGNYLREFSRDYFTERHHTPWGAALNIDGPNSRPVRDFFINNALYWAHEFHIDGLRLDATHAIIDDSPRHLLAEMAATVRASLPPERNFLCIAENEHNDPAIVRPLATATQPVDDDPATALAWGLDGVWADDFHHQVRVALTGERDGYYADYTGTAADLAATIRQGWFYQGQEMPHQQRARGAVADDVEPPHFVYCIQNHDQVGNRARGERLHHDIDLDAYRAASALLLLVPHTPLLWMGQEWAASTPFQFFTDHNPELGRLVTEGRRREFAAFTAFSGETVPDPQLEATFLRAKLRWQERDAEPHRSVLTLYRDLLKLRRTHPALRERSRDSFVASAIGDKVLLLQRHAPASEVLLLVINLGGACSVDLAPHTTEIKLLLDSEDKRYGGHGALNVSGSNLALDGPRALVLEHS
ncbi:malto-oligosyltrehalose trehalohydrolase [Candidatus Gracilibacteria bacterium]|nr:malto-oligosyltrehalose trehalohydrolase [Candidatus Gracilibacteria bacterium]